MGGAKDVKFLVVIAGHRQELNRPFHYKHARKWAFWNWIRPTIDIMFDGSSSSVHVQMKMLLGEFRNPTLYHRFQGPLISANDDLDDSRPENIEALQKMAIQLYEGYTDFGESVDFLLRIAQENGRGQEDLCSLSVFGGF